MKQTKKQKQQKKTKIYLKSIKQNEIDFFLATLVYKQAWILGLFPASNWEHYDAIEDHH